MTIPNAEVMGAMFAQVVEFASSKQDRSVQSAEGRLGPSDLGFCHQKAALMTKGVKATDSKPTWAAAVGTAVHVFLAESFGKAFPDWICDSTKVTAEFPNGAKITGTPDIIIPEWNAIVDHKTVDGFEWVRRNGVSQNHKFQRHTYAMGAVAAGLLTEDKPIYLVNVYWDRSGKEATPHIEIAEFDPTLTDEVNAWIDDVIYAVEHKEDAERDIPAPVCEKICEFFTVCRGSLPDSDDPSLILDPEAKTAVEMYVEARDLEKQAKQMKSEASNRLTGISGSTGEWQVRWTHVPEQDIAGFTRRASDRIDVRKVRRAAKGGVDV